MSEVLLKNTFNKLSPAYELVADVTVGVATTQVNFSGLNFGKDDDLMLVHDVTKTTGGDILYVNGNTTSTNYYSQTLRADGTSIPAYRSNNSSISPTAGGGGRKQLVITHLKLANSGYLVYQSNCGQYLDNGTPYVQIFNMCGTSTFTMTSITSLTIAGLTANDIPAGSRFQLYRLKAKKVADIIVGSATTQLNITGLNIDKDSEYMLVSDFNNTTTDSALYLFINGNNTNTNYYSHYLLATSTTMASTRYNNAEFMSTFTNTKAYAVTNIKLTNSGYFTFQSKTARQYGGGEVIALNYNGNSAFTATSVTSISIVSSVTNAIGIGSRFQLYKMK